MIRVLALLAAAGLAAAAPAPKTEALHPVSLKGLTNVKMDENLHSNNFPNNNLKSLPTGKQKMNDIAFEIGEGVLQLGSSNVEKPTKIEGIKVDRTAKKLHFLHSTGYNTAPDTVIGKYVVRYDDKTTAEIDIVYGRDVVDWWAYPDQAAPTKAKAGWEGENEASKSFEAKIKLYTMSWENPKPDKKVVSIDFVAPNPEQTSAPFCVAITVDER